MSEGLAVLGHPLAVDPDYGGAERLRFRHRTAGKQVEIEAPLPPDLEPAIALLRRST